MKKELTLKNILILIGAIYLIVTVERFLSRETYNSEMIVQYRQDKEVMKADIDLLNTKLFNYEVKILKIRQSVIDMSNVELDSTWSDIFK